MKAHLMVPSLLFCCSASTKGRNTARSASCSRKAFERLLIPSMPEGNFFQSHSRTCPAR